MQNDSDSPVSEEEQICVGYITAKILSPTHKRKTYEVNSTSEDWFVILEVNGAKTRFKIDSGSQINIIPKKDYQLLKNEFRLKPTRTRLQRHLYPSTRKMCSTNSKQKQHIGCPNICNRHWRLSSPRTKNQCSYAPIKKSSQHLKERTCFLLEILKLFWGTRDITWVSSHYNGPKYKTHHKPTTQSTTCPQTETKTGAAMNDSAWHNCSCQWSHRLGSLSCSDRKTQWQHMSLFRPSKSKQGN